tara:strand:+ start:2297 stop:2866 length:570 start_codon:yes stop_codon:yes gene_type:complete
MASKAIDTVIVFRVLKLLTTKWEDHEAFKTGLIDANGKRIKSKKPKTKEEKNSYTYLHRLVFNLKRLIEMLPLGKNRLASYAAALFLIKEHCGLKTNKLDKEVFKYLKEGEFLSEDLLEEFLPIDKLESEKTFHLRRKMIIDENIDAERGDTLINSGAKPVGKVYGVKLFRMYNIDKNKMMICSGHDLR